MMALGRAFTGWHRAGRLHDGAGQGIYMRWSTVTHLMSCMVAQCSAFAQG